MYKRSICVAMLFHGVAMQAAEPSIPFAKIEDNIVKLATHYRLIQASTTLTHDHSAQPVEVINKPKAFFYGYDREANTSNFLGAVEVDALDKQTIESLNQLIDPAVSLPTIKKAVISHCLKRGRILRFYDEQGHTVVTTYHYGGSVDIKSESDNMRLIKPHALLQQLEEVREIVPPAWYLAMLGFADREERVVYENR